LDILPTFATLAGYDVPTDRIIDGVDQTALLSGRSDTGARDNFYYYFCGGSLRGVRKGKWKLLLPNRVYCYRYVKDRGTGGIELYDLESDVGETMNVAKQHPEIVAELRKLAEAFRSPPTMAPGGRGKKRRALPVGTSLGDSP